MSRDQEKLQALTQIRKATNAPVALCGEALTACSQDVNQAIAYIQAKQEQARIAAEPPKTIEPPPSMSHPVLGELQASEQGGWHTLVPLPAFRSCYERWSFDGSERRDTRNDDRCQGRFVVWFQPESRPSERGNRRNYKDEKIAPPPSDFQIAAFEYLVQNQARIAEEIFATLAEDLPKEMPWLIESDLLSDAVKKKIATADGMTGAVELQAVCITLRAEGGCSFVGFAFHSELLEPEHGIGVLTWRDEIEALGCAEVLEMW